MERSDGENSFLMARYTSAYSSFSLRLKEVETLRQFAASKEREDPLGLSTQINALGRGAIVLLSAHLEAFIRELGELALDGLYEKNIQRSKLPLQIFYHISKDLIDDIINSSEPAKIADKMFTFIESDISSWARSGSFPSSLQADRFNKGFGNPAFRKIKAYFNRFGYSDYQKELGRALRAEYPVTINMVDHLVDTRNKIAHGDWAMTKTPLEIKDMMRVVKVYCRATDSCFASWWGSHFCPIR